MPRTNALHNEEHKGRVQRRNKECGMKSRLLDGGHFSRYEVLICLSHA